MAWPGNDRAAMGARRANRCMLLAGLMHTARQSRHAGHRSSRDEGTNADSTVKLVASVSQDRVGYSRIDLSGFLTA